MEMDNTTTAAFYLSRLFTPVVASSPYPVPASEPVPNISKGPQMNLALKSNTKSKFNCHTADMEKLIQKAASRMNVLRNDSDQNVVKNVSVMERRPSKVHKHTNKITPDINIQFLKEPTRTRDVATQTDFLTVELEKANAKIAQLYKKVNILQAQVDEAKRQGWICDEGISSEVSDEEFEIPKSKSRRKKRKLETPIKDTDESFAYATEQDTMELTEYDEPPDSNTSKLSNHILRIRDVNTINRDMVPIGDGYAKVPSRLLKRMNWNSYTSVTRKLLSAIFSRRVLATHSLTGKPSPAFPDKPAKKKLDPALVNDIVQTVVERCRVPENVVRTSITTKCADESKMFRTREKKLKKRQNKKNRENIPPATSDSDE